MRDRITAKPTNPPNRLLKLTYWAFLASLLLLSQYGPNVALPFSVGLIATTVFALIFWLVDRCRRRVPAPIMPTPEERLIMLGVSGVLLVFAVAIVSRTSTYPVRTLGAIALIVLPLPAGLLSRLYQQSRYHARPDGSQLLRPKRSAAKSSAPHR